MAADAEEGEGVEAEAQKLQTRVREAKLRAKLAKEQEKSQLAQERKVDETNFGRRRMLSGELNYTATGEAGPTSIFVFHLIGIFGIVGT